MQGEGPYAGYPAVFVRTFGCVAPFCKFCDTPYSWKGKAPYNNASIDTIVDAIKLQIWKGNELIVITGGEPFAQPAIYKLEKKLQKYAIQFETSAKVRINPYKLGMTTHLVISPKTYDKKSFNVDKLTMKRLKRRDYYNTNFKFLYDPTGKTGYTIQMIEAFVEEWKIPSTRVWLMPLGHTRKLQIENMQKTVDMAIEKGYRFSARLHTLTWDLKRGV